MYKYGLPIRILLASTVWLFTVDIHAIPSLGEIDSSYCIVPVLGGNGGLRGISDFFKTYPIPPYVLVNDKFGSLWTIKGFNESSVYTPEITLDYFDSSIFSIEQGAVFSFDRYAFEKDSSYTKKVYKFNGIGYPEIVDGDEIKSLGDIEKTLKNQYQKQKDMALLKNDLYAAVRPSGLYIAHPSGQSQLVLGNQLVRPTTIELYPMVGRGDVLVNTYNGLFILAENTEINSGYCRQVIPTKDNNFKLTPLLTNIQDDVIFGAVKTGDNKYLIYMQSDKYWVNEDGKVKQAKIVSDTFDGILIKNLKSDNFRKSSTAVNSLKAYPINTSEELGRLNSFPISDTKKISYYCSDDRYLYFIYQDKVIRWNEVEGLRELTDLDKSKHGAPVSLMVLDGKLIVVGTQGAFKINNNGEATAYIADLYKVGSIKKIEPIPNHQAYLAYGSYGLFVIDKNEVVSRLYLDGRVNEYFNGELVYDGIESYIKTSTGIFRIDSIDNN